MSKTGVIIANTGSPASPTPQAVRSYLSEFLTDPRICPMHPVLWRMILNAFILPIRSKVSAKKYVQIWSDDGSPLVVHMRSLAAKLQNALGPDSFIVRCGMSYGKPSMYDALSELHNEGCDEIAVIALYPQSAYSTSFVVEDKLRQELDTLKWTPRLRFIRDYSDKPLYYESIAQSVLDAGFDSKEDQLLMAFHSIPMKDIDSGDTYAEQVASSALNIAKRLGVSEDSWHVGFQCRFDKSRSWLGPTTSEILSALDKNKRLFVVTPNFSIDCLETLYDIEMELKSTFLDANPNVKDGSFNYVACLNDSDAQIELLKSLVDQEG